MPFRFEDAPAPSAKAKTMDYYWAGRGGVTTLALSSATGGVCNWFAPGTLSWSTEINAVTIAL